MNKNYFLYKTTNLINNKIYIGVHATKHINDCYLGSGKHLKNAIKKYGKENFKREILEFFNSYEDALLKENEIVNQDFINRIDTYNIVNGGGMPPIKYGDKHHYFNRRLFGENNHFFGKKHTEQTKLKMRKLKLGKKLSEKNKKNLLELSTKYWKIITPSNEEIVIKNLNEFSLRFLRD
jgi:group I intron endonuclease